MIEKLYKEWCEETKRNDSPIREFFKWLKDKGYSLKHSKNDIYPHKSHLKEIEHIGEIA
jgi:hypothetical protein